MCKLFANFFLTLSCFSPLYLIMGVRNICEILNLRKEIATANEDMIVLLTQNLNYNTILVVVWVILLLVSVAGIICFICDFLGAKNKSGRNIKIIGAQNITAKYFFTYFSLFVVSFFTIDPTDIEHLTDVVILGILLGLMIIVYIRNDMYFINPILNILNYKSYLITYQRCNAPSGDSDGKEQKQFEARVFSKDKLDHEINETYFIKISQYNFSICLKKK